jgi:putative phage-type endonuclease
MKHLKFKTKEEWLKWRLTGIGGSDAYVIMEQVPSSWGTPQSLYAEKIGGKAEREVNYAMRRGLALEPRALEEYCQLKGMEFRKGYFENRETAPWLIVSVDGVTKDFKNAVEIKCSGSMDHGLAKKGVIPDKYKYQLTHILMVLGLPEMDYFSYKPGDSVLLKFKMDRDMAAKLLTAERRFWECVLNKVAPVKKQPPKIDPGMGFQQKLVLFQGGKK